MSSLDAFCPMDVFKESSRCLWFMLALSFDMAATTSWVQLSFLLHLLLPLRQPPPELSQSSVMWIRKYIFSLFTGQNEHRMPCMLTMSLVYEIINSWETITEISPKLLAKLHLSLRRLYSMCLVALWLHLPLVNQGPSSSGWVDPNDTYLLSQLQLNIVI